MKILVSTDETTESENRFVANDVIGVLSHKLTKPILQTTEELNTDHAPIIRLFSNSLKFLA